jgi:peroxiredoxin
VSWLGHLTPLQLLGVSGGAVALGLLALLGLEGWALVNLLRQNGRLLLRVETLEARLEGAGAAPAPAPVPAAPEPGLPVGTPAPAFSLSGLYGETLTLDALRAAGKPVLLAFTDPHCGPCQALLPELGAWQREHAARLTVAPISRGTPEANRAKSTEHGLMNVLLQQGNEVAAAYQVAGTPGAVVVNPNGTVGSPLALGADAIRALVARTVGTPEAPVPTAAVPAPQDNGAAPAPNGHGAPNGPGAAPSAPAPNGTIPLPVAPAAASRIGQPAPTLRLPDLDGRMVDLAAFLGARTLVLFWNPGCGFCRQMLDDLKAWEANAPAGAPKLLVVSTGTVQENRALGLRAPVLLDQGSGVMSAFGANGTPMAVLVDAQGRMASAVAAGAPAVLALARGEHDQVKAAS